MRRSAVAAFALILAFTALRPALGQEAQKVADGREIALKVCAICHVVTEDQAVPPTMKPPAPRFAEIAARPSVNEAFLRDFLLKPHGEARERHARHPDAELPGRRGDRVSEEFEGQAVKPLSQRERGRGEGFGASVEG